MVKKIKSTNKWVLIAIGLLLVMAINIIFTSEGITENRKALQTEEAAFDKKVEKQEVADDKKDEAAKAQADRKKEQEDAIAEMQASRVSFEEFTSIEEGMSKDQVVDIIGGPLELLSESGSAQIYMAEGVGSLGANANFTFVDGKLYAKAQFGLGGN